MEQRQQLTIVGEPGGISVELHRGTVISFGPDRIDLQVEVVRGDVWFTAEGDPSDRILRAGDHDCLAGRHVVAEALSDSVIKVA